MHSIEQKWLYIDNYEWLLSKKKEKFEDTNLYK